ncbi:hypothetical protein ECG_02570 [Echinococcus granulosus]|uniref:Pdz domain containing protein n=1 Tax=Echinococcus granulosus TaxID=6210 RepID=A0A068WN67_ECHGR|nr:hypothetical protein ECG_02570 [Echinococcus granulosus]CDS21568.1 pdz domain containing protein [Echinococcus granulosus]
MGGDLGRYELRRDRNSDRWGFKITTCGNLTYITGVYENTPAARAGVGLNTIMVKINGIPCENVSHDQICQAIQKADRYMTLVTRRPCSDDVGKVNENTRHMALKASNTAGDHEDMPKSTKEIENKQRLKFKKHSENDHPSQPKEREEVKEKTSSKHHSESVMPLHETNMDESRNNEKKKRTPQDQRRRRSSSDVKGSANRPTSGVVENETTRNVHRSEDVHRAESSLPKKKSKHLQKSKSEGDVVVVKTYRSSTVTQKKGEEGEAKVENPEPSFPSVYELQTSLPAGKRRTLLLSNGKSLEDRIASLNDL